MGQIKSKNKKRFISNGWGFIIPALLIITVLVIIPIASSIVFSTYTGKGTVMKFNGIGNVIRLFKDKLFFNALKNNFIYFIFQVPIMLMLAMILANMLNDKNLKFRGIYRTAIFIPSVTSLVSYSILFKSMFAVDGIINKALIAIDIINEPIKWLIDPFWAKVTVIIAIIWRWTGYNMIFYLAGLQNLDPSMFEQAKIDGASSIRQFFSITLPGLKPIILFTAIMSTIGTLQLFDEVVNLTRGGPGDATTTVSQYIYNLAFRYTPNFGYSATVALSIAIIIALLSAIQIKIGNDKNE